MAAMAVQVQQRVARIKPGTLRKYCIAFLLIGGLGEWWLIHAALEDRVPVVHYTAIRPVVTAGNSRKGDGQREAGDCFRQRWDSLLRNPAARSYWDSLVRARPGLADTLRQLEAMDSALKGK